MTSSAGIGTALTLSEDEAAAVAAVAAAFAEALPPGRAEPYLRLASAAQREGAVSAEQIGTLEQVCSLALETGKARQIGRAESERLLTAVLRRTPRGRAVTGQVDDVNRALGELAGRQLDSARLTWRMPGHCELSISAGGVNLTLAITPDDVSVRSLSVG